MNSALRTLTSGQIPATTGTRQLLDPLQKILQQADVEYRLRHRVFSSGLHLELKPPDLFIQVGKPRIRSDADHKARTRTDRVSAQIQPPVQVVDDINQADGIHIKDRRRVRIVAHLWRIAGNTDQILDPHCSRSQQVTLDAQHIAVAAGVVQNRFDSRFLLHQQRKRLIAHARRSPRAVRNVDRIHSH